MYKHHTWKNQLLYHQLENENSLLKIAPSRGGIITEWIFDNQPVLYLEEATLLNPEQNIRGGIPILFPICGPLQEGKYTIADSTYQMKQHGLARNMPWQVTNTELAAKEAKITLTTESTPETKKVYPFDFRLVFTYLFRGNSLTIQQGYQNISSAEDSLLPSARMPFYAGFHPYFWAPNRDLIQLKIAAENYFDLIKGETGTTLNVLSLTEVPEANYVFGGLRTHQAVIDNLGTGRKILLEFAPEFKYIVLWALEGKDFFCFEPWMAGNYALNTGQGLISLGPGEHLDTWVKITVQ